jgi:hypothetical protein
MKHIQNNQKPQENLFQPMDFKNLKKKVRGPKVFRSWQMFQISKKKTIR